MTDTPIDHYQAAIDGIDGSPAPRTHALLYIGQQVEKLVAEARLGALLLNDIHGDLNVANALTDRADRDDVTAMLHTSSGDRMLAGTRERLGLLPSDSLVAIRAEERERTLELVRSGELIP